MEHLAQEQDWFELAISENELLCQKHCNSRRSAEWCSWTPSISESEIVRRVMHAVRNVTRNHGVPRNTEIRLASMDDIGAGAAGFHDAPHSFRKPFILLDRSPVKSCHRDEVMDVYCGIALHEAGHILHTRDGYVRFARPGRDTLLNNFENLIEDDRIERLVCQYSPGYAPYVFAARRQLLEDGSFGKSMLDWDSLPDLDKILALISAFIRIPHLIPSVAKSWRALNGECVFEQLRCLLPIQPKTEADVERMAQAVYDFYSSLQSCYGASEGQDEVDGGSGDSCGAQDENPGVGTDSREGRFGPQELAAAIRATGTVVDGFDEAEIQIAGIHDGIERPYADFEVVEQKDWEWMGESRQVLIESAAADHCSDRRYQESCARVSHLVNRMKSALPSCVSGTVVLRDQFTGRVDSRRIALAQFSPRIFRTTSVTPEKRIALGLLLDASGSMQGIRADFALDAAVLMNEAFDRDGRVDLNVFSHTSSPIDDSSCVIRIHQGVNARTVNSIGSYGPERENYDHCAIETVNRLLQKSATKTARRILIVVSDGSPAGVNYGSQDAVQATANAVRLARKSGTTVVGIGIDGYYCDEIYGDRWHLNVADCKQLPNELRKLLTRMLRGN